MTNYRASFNSDADYLTGLREIAHMLIGHCDFTEDGSMTADELIGYYNAPYFTRPDGFGTDDERELKAQIERVRELESVELSD